MHLARSIYISAPDYNENFIIFLLKDNRDIINMESELVSSALTSSFAVVES